jgi:N-carbamoyl-L-amino-acid hydrolase
MRQHLAPDIDLAVSLFEALRAQGFDGVGITREAYGPREQGAHDIVRRAAERIGLELAVDPAGNLLMTLPGTDRAAPCLVLGSHLDSVPQGGCYDGPAGVLAGLATVAGMRRAGYVPGADITVLVTRAEEAGAWFPTSYPGSRAALGRLDAATLAVPRADTGRTLEEHMREAGFDPDAVRAGRCLLPPARVRGYLELHIEQGPVLDSEQIAVGIVTGIPGSRRLRAARVLGEWNHSGAVPRAWRRDAAIALAELACRVDETWGDLETRGHRIVVTFCELATAAGAGMGRIAGEASFVLDVRGVERASIDLLWEAFVRIAAEVEARRGVRIEFGPETGSAASPMEASIQAGLERAARSLGIAHRRMASGGGHDAAAFAQAGVPAGMLFVRNQNGSHNPQEAMRFEDFAQACAVMTAWAAEVTCA